MTGLIAKDFLVFKKRFHFLYRLVGAAILALAVIIYPNEGVQYIALLLPVIGVAFLTEIIKVEEKSDWKDYLPVLPVTSREIVLSRYVFCGILIVSFAALSLILCTAASILGDFALSAVIPDFILGVWYAVLLVCFGIPGGYFFKNEMCTGAMISSCFVILGVRTLGIDAVLFSRGTLMAWIVMIIVVALMLYVSYRAALWIYATKRYSKSKVGTGEAA